MEETKPIETPFGVVWVKDDGKTVSTYTEVDDDGNNQAVS